MDQVKQIVDILIEELSKRIAESGLKISITEAAKNKIAKEGYDKTFGARPLKRTIQRLIETPLSTKIIKGEIKNKEIIVDIENDKLIFKQK